MIRGVDKHFIAYFLIIGKSGYKRYRLCNFLAVRFNAF